MAQNVDILCLMLGFPDDVRRMTLSEDHGLLKHMRPKTILIDHTTSSPELSRQIHSHALRHQIEALDAPVSGGEGGAKSG